MADQRTNQGVIRVCGGGPPVDDPPVNDRCVPHTPAPSGYVDWHEWAKRMGRTHYQHRCPGCGLYKVWIAKVATK